MFLKTSYEWLFMKVNSENIETHVMYGLEKFHVLGTITLEEYCDIV